MPALMAEFKKKYPEVNFKIIPTDSVGALRALENSLVDFAAVGSLKGYEKKFEKLNLRRKNLC